MCGVMFCNGNGGRLVDKNFGRCHPLHWVKGGKVSSTGKGRKSINECFGLTDMWGYTGGSVRLGGIEDMDQ